MSEEYVFSTTLFRWGKHPNWLWLRVPTALTEEIEARYGTQKRGWDTIPILVTVGAITWETSMFRERNAGRNGELGDFHFPVRAAVRKSLGIDEGSAVDATMTIRLPSKASA